LCIRQKFDLKILSLANLSSKSPKF
jgi:hypothetical protein